MASKKTPNLGLDIWQPEDFFKRAEVNNNFTKIDNGIGDLSQKVTAELAQKATKDTFMNVKDYLKIPEINYTEAFKRVYESVRIQTKKRPIYVSADLSITLTEPLVLFGGLQIYGEGRANSEFGNKAIIQNYTTDMFSLANNVSDVTFWGIEFRGSDTLNFIQKQDFGLGYILQYSTISYCGFNGWKNVIDGRILGVKIQNNFINNGLGSLSVAGSDSTIGNNFIDNASKISKNNYLVYFKNLSLSKFENNYLTGSTTFGKGCIPFVMEQGQGNTISRNWFDYSAGSGMYLVNTQGHTIRDNFFRGNMQAPFDQYNAVITMFDTSNVLFSGNQFIDQISGVNTFAFRKTANGTNNITIRDNVYKNGYDLKLYAPVGESSDIFIDEPTTTYNKGKFWSGTKWETPLVRKPYASLNISFGAYATVTAQSSKTYDVVLADTIPTACLKSVTFSTSTPLESGVLCEVITTGTTTIKLRFTNVKGTDIVLADKNYSLMFMY